MKIRAALAVFLLAVLATACTSTSTSPRVDAIELRAEESDSTTTDGGHGVGSGG